jgi:hypothetical protein
MNIYEAVRRAWDGKLWLRKRDRSIEWTLYVAAGNVFRNEKGEQVNLDARDVHGDDWYLVDDQGNEVK